MSLFSKLFGGGGTVSEPEAIEHSGFSITPTPVKEGNEYRICATIEKEIDGEMKTHKLIRADTVAGQGAATDASVNKAKQLIDQMGDRLFN